MCDVDERLARKYDACDSALFILEWTASDEPGVIFPEAACDGKWGVADDSRGACHDAVST